MADKSMAEAIEGMEGIQRVERYLSLWTYAYLQDPKNNDWSSTITPHLSIVSHSASLPHPNITFRLTVQPIHNNGLNNMHGGCTSTIFDLCTTMPLHLISKPGFWQWLGVSRTLNVTYLRPIPVGSIVDIECEIVQVGRKICTLRGVMRAVTADGKEGPSLAVCEHGKVSTDPPAEKL
ncbi:Uu.00g077500.m01.CDS01 [Anthostomella pinea]|uniref:Uu.00g077500.m01.CDS01 n=1 Tax=Anthostomella pinea TaxID=933095 RepID=A0AAI8YPD7_9PEZI|nr:Uu.00g077500.m01.CDS01 [Anthostomella pinea]